MTFDRDGYPTEEALDKLRKWPMEDAVGWLEEARSLWYYPSHAKMEYRTSPFGKPEVFWTFATGGWSGNEEVISAMRENHILWAFTWQLSARGGYFEFSLPKVRPT